MICQAAGKDIGQFCQEAETTLSRFDALFFELLVQGLDYPGDLQFGKEKAKETDQSPQASRAPQQPALLGCRHEQQSKRQHPSPEESGLGTGDKTAPVKKRNSDRRAGGDPTLHCRVLQTPLPEGGVTP